MKITHRSRSRTRRRDRYAPYRQPTSRHPTVRTNTSDRQNEDVNIMWMASRRSNPLSILPPTRSKRPNNQDDNSSQSRHVNRIPSVDSALFNFTSSRIADRKKTNRCDKPSSKKKTSKKVVPKATKKVVPEAKGNYYTLAKIVDYLQTRTLAFYFRNHPEEEKVKGFATVTKSLMAASVVHLGGKHTKFSDSYLRGLRKGLSFASNRHEEQLLTKNRNGTESSGGKIGSVEMRKKSQKEIDTVEGSHPFGKRKTKKEARQEEIERLLKEIECGDKTNDKDRSRTSSKKFNDSRTRGSNLNFNDSRKRGSNSNFNESLKRGSNSNFNESLKRGSNSNFNESLKRGSNSNFNESLKRGSNSNFNESLKRGSNSNFNESLKRGSNSNFNESRKRESNSNMFKDSRKNRKTVDEDKEKFAVKFCRFDELQNRRLLRKRRNSEISRRQRPGTVHFSKLGDDKVY